MKHSISLAILTLLAAACGEEKARANGVCRGGQLESDLDPSPWMGAGVDPDTGRPRLAADKSYVVSATYGVPVPGTGGKPVTEKYLTLFANIQTELERQPGLVGMQLASSDACASGRTLAVWESEEAMYAFVTGPAHLAAMSAVNEVLKPGYVVTHWSASDLAEMSFEQSVKAIAQEESAR